MVSKKMEWNASVQMRHQERLQTITSVERDGDGRDREEYMHFGRVQTRLSGRRDWNAQPVRKRTRYQVTQLSCPFELGRTGIEKWRKM